MSAFNPAKDRLNFVKDFFFERSGYYTLVKSGFKTFSLFY